MNRGRVAGGYTIVEVLIVLAVTAVTAMSAWALISGQQRRTEYNTASRDIELRVQDIINDVSTGYYAKSSNFSCSNVGGNVQINTSGSANQGSNTDCIFLGRAIQFATAGSSGAGYKVYDIIGLRMSGTKYVETLAQAKPQVLIIPTTDETLPGGFQVKSASSNAFTIAFISSLAEYAAGGSSADIISGAQSVNTYIVPNSASSQDGATVATNISSLGTATANPTGGVRICMEGGVTNQHVILAIGADQDKSATKLQFNTGAGCPAVL